MAESDVRWRALADDLRARIASGEYSTGARIPSYRVLAERHDVAVGTARAAVEALMRERLIHSTPGVGLFVGPPTTPAAAHGVEERLAALEEDMSNVKRILGLDQHE
jgi:GntR family transcriptional regulator